MSGTEGSNNEVGREAAEDDISQLFKNTVKVFLDPIHGHIALPSLLVKIIDTPEFQRLRHIKQLGTKYLVYPSATHTRFEHSVGVAHLAGCLLKSLHENQPELRITKRDFLCVQIAALCHDMGHGPFSHLFDGMFIPAVLPDVNWEHEKASVQMFHCMRKKNGLDREMKDCGLNLDEDMVFIEELILKGQRDGQWSMKGRTEEKSFLYEIVANKVNGIDVDKWDYLTRDCYYLGIPCGFDYQRLLKTARVCEVNGRKHICFRDKVAENVYGMFHTRYTLHRQALQHKTGYIIDVKIKDALVLADKELMPGHNISDAIKNMTEYTRLTDHICDQILQKENPKPKLAEAAAVLEDIASRRLPKFVGEARLKEDALQEMLKKHWEELLNSKTDLQAEDSAFCKKMVKSLEVRPDDAFKNGVFQKMLLASLGKEPNDAFKTEEIKAKSPKAQPVKDFKMKVYEEILKTYGEFGALDSEDIGIYVLQMGFGEVGNEPIENVHFYSKSELNTAFKMEKHQVSSLKPKKFHEWLVRVYYKKIQKDKNDLKEQQEKLREAKKSFHEWCKTNNNKFIDFGPNPDDEEEDEEEVVDEESSSGKIFNDPIYGQIELDHRLMEIIDTPEFQRLRHIKQLGAASLVYPGATHTRFEHSLGMAHLAGWLANVLKEKQEEDLEKIEEDLEKKQMVPREKQNYLSEKKKELINKKDILCVQIAALCYNLGHGPFSHMYEKFISKAQFADTESIEEEQQQDKGENWKVASIWIFLEIVEKSDLLKEELKKNDLTFIQKLIEGDETAAPKNKAFLCDIVANKWNGIDVRRWDYFARDCYHLGIPNSFDHQRLLKSARVCDVNGMKRICFRDKVAENIYDMFHTRYSLYLQCYKHKIVSIIEDKITDALFKAKDNFTPISVSPDEINQKITEITMSLILENKDEQTAKFIRLTDHVFERILYSEKDVMSLSDEQLKAAQKELEDVVKRRLPKCVGETRLKDDEDKNTFQTNWNTAVDEWNERHPDVFLDKMDFSVAVIKLDYNKELENPIEHVYFYRKNKTKAHKIKPYEVSSLLPEKFSENVGRIYYTKKSDEEEKDAKECFDWWRRGKPGILVFDEKRFRGNWCFITKDCPSLEGRIKAVRSCKVIRGVWDLFEGNGYVEPYYRLDEGDYHSPTGWGANRPNAPALSLKRVTYEIQLYEQEDFGGKMYEITEDCPSLVSSNITGVRSCKVIRGVWTIYKDCKYDNPYPYPLEEGVYRNPTVWGAKSASDSVLSIERGTLCQIKLYEENDFKGPVHETTRDCLSLDNCSIKAVRSCKVIRGVWKLYKDREYRGAYCQLNRGNYNKLEPWSEDRSTTPPSAQSVECVTSCKVQLFQNHGFKEPMHETATNLPSLDDCSINEVRSCKVIRGDWKLYEDRDYGGAYYLLNQGEYYSPAEWGSIDPSDPALSVRCVNE